MNTHSYGVSVAALQKPQRRCQQLSNTKPKKTAYSAIGVRARNSVAPLGTERDGLGKALDIGDVICLWRVKATSVEVEFEYWAVFS